MPLQIGSDHIRWLDPISGVRTYNLRVPLQRKVPGVRQRRFVTESFDYSTRLVLPLGNPVWEVAGLIEYESDPDLLLEMLLFGANGGELTYHHGKSGTDYLCALIEPSTDLIELLVQEDMRPAFLEYQIPIRLRRIEPGTFEAVLS